MGIGLCSLVITLLGVISQAPSSTSLAVMSVDLGLEWLKIAIVKPGVPMEIVLNKESRRKTPVVVSLKDGDLQVSDPAMSTATRHPKSAYFYLQDLLAKSIDAPSVQTFKKRFPFYDLVEDEERGTVLFKHNEERNFSPEELLAIILNKSREIASDFAEQPIKDIVITVPVYFNQAERKAILYAAELADLKVLQLMNANTAVALNYGVFRRNDFNSTPTNIMFYDMGAGSTVTTIVSYQLAKIKEKGVAETNPQLVIKGVGLHSESVQAFPMHGRYAIHEEVNPELEIRGVGFDRTLGGLEMELRLRDHLAKMFTKQKKTKNSVYESPRAMAKLLKEAKRVKKVLSANTDHFSQIEGLLDDKDFTPTKVTRAELEQMNTDLFDRIEGPIAEALKMSEMSMSEIDQVILVGGGTRVPKVQEILLKVTGKKELAKNINADEAAALGAVYQAAHLGKGFKVKKFIIKDANLYPIQVSFQRVNFGEEGEEDTIKTVKRTLFGRSNPYPQKKVMTFNRHTGDFNFNVGYSDLESIISEEDLQNFGSHNLTTYSLSGVADALAKNSEVESKGIKAHFRMDDSGILHLDNVESVFERTEQVLVEVNDTDGQSTFANPMWKGFEELSSTITNFFSGGKEDGDKEDQPKTEDEETTEKEQEGVSTYEEVTTSEDKTMDSLSEENVEQKPEENTDEEETQADKSDTEEKAEKQEMDETETKESETEVPEEPKEDAKETEDTETAEDKKQTDSANEEDKEESEKTTENVEEKKNNKEESFEKKANKEGSDKNGKKEKKKVAKPKVVSIKENITVNFETKDVPQASKESRIASRNKLKEIKKKEEAKIEKEKALNNLESFIYDTQDKLYSEMWEKCSVDDERDTIRTTLSEASDWLYEVPDDAEAKIYKDKHKELKKIVKDLKFRIKEEQERPEFIKALKDAFNYSHILLTAAKNFSEADQIFTETEIKLLTTIYNDTLEWFRTKSAEQEKTPCTHEPIYKDKHKELKKIVKDLKFRIKEEQERPEFIKALKDAFNYSHILLTAAKNFSEADQIFTETEIKLLTTIYNDTLEWFRTKSAEQEKTPCTHEPVMLTADMKEKFLKLDRELQYLYNKAKSQPKKKKPKKTKGKKKSNETETTGEGNREEEEENTKTKAEDEDKPTGEDDAPIEDPDTETKAEAPSEDKDEEQEETLQLGEDDAPTEDQKHKEEAPSKDKEEQVEILQLEDAGNSEESSKEKTPIDEKTEKSSDSKLNADSQSKTSKIKTDQSDETYDHNAESNSHNTGEL